MKTKIKTQHTPTPRYFDTKMKEFLPKSEGGGEKITLHAGNKRIGTSNREDLAEAKVNAAFIVRAVNSHEELVWQLKSAQRWIDRARTLLTPDQQGYCGFHNDSPTQKAIAKAEGKL